MKWSPLRALRAWTRQLLQGSASLWLCLLHHVCSSLLGSARELAVTALHMPAQAATASSALVMAGPGARQQVTDLRCPPVQALVPAGLAYVRGLGAWGPPLG